MPVDPTIIGAIVVCIIVILVLGKAFLGMAKREGEKMTKKDMLQRKVDDLARGSDAERWQAVGKSSREAAKSGGCLGKLVLLGIIIIVLLALFDVFIGNGEVIKSILKNLGR